MSDQFELSERPKAKEIYMLAGWRQWVDGGGMSSGLPDYLIQEYDAKKIGTINPDGYYLFQLPGAQHFMRPMVRHKDGHPQGIHTQRNEFHYAEIGNKGVVFFIGDEPHMDVERYTRAFLNAARELKVKRIILFGGIYAEVPYDKERYSTSIYSLPSLREEVDNLAVDLSNYQGPGSIGSYVCQRAGEHKIEVIGFYSFCPIYQFGSMEEISKTIRVENDYIAWLGAMRRVNHMLQLTFDLEELETKGDELIKKLDDNVSELDEKYPDLRVGEYMERLRNEFQEKSFSPLEDVWEQELRRLGDEFFPSEE
ncbi:MAG: PAC2 family protein [Chloroflexi bacterium]|nr:PAC2 family protein [Chloroflexota bacterium]